MNQLPLVSVGVPVFNGGEQLRFALDALLRQDYERLEVIITDNASTDSTPLLCREYAARDARVRWVRLEHRIAAAENFNLGLRLASGEYFMWAAHDDLREPTFVSKLAAALQSNPAAMLAFCRFDNIDSRGTVIRRFAHDWARILAGPHSHQLVRFALPDEARSQKGIFVYGLFRREALVACGGIAQQKTEHIGEDIILLIRLLLRGQFVFVDELLFHYRVRAVIGPGGQHLASHLFKRVFGRTPGHQGNLLLALKRNRLMYVGIRQVVTEQTSIGRWLKLLLVVALYARESAVPVRLAIALLRELRSPNTVDSSEV